MVAHLLISKRCSFLCLHLSVNLDTSLKLPNISFTSLIDYLKTYWKPCKFLLGILACLQIYVLYFQ